MTDAPEATKKTARTKAELIVQMTKEAKRVERRCGAQACILICFFEDGKQITLQDAGQFPMPPDEFYQVMARAHQDGKFETDKPKTKIIRPH